jgi:hypothetical protein
MSFTLPYSKRKKKLATERLQTFKLPAELHDVFICQKEM